MNALRAIFWGAVLVLCIVALAVACLVVAFHIRDSLVGAGWHRVAASFTGYGTAIAILAGLMWVEHQINGED